MGNCTVIWDLWCLWWQEMGSVSEEEDVTETQPGQAT